MCRANGRFSTAIVTPDSSCRTASSSKERSSVLTTRGSQPRWRALQVGVHHVDARAELGGDGQVPAVLVERRAVPRDGPAAVLEVEKRTVDGERQPGQLDDAGVGRLSSRLCWPRERISAAGAISAMRSRAAASEKFAYAPVEIPMSS